MVQQFIEFKLRTDEKLKKAKADGITMALMEKLLAMKSPTLEAEYAIDERTYLSLYDCLIPLL